MDKPQKINAGRDRLFTELSNSVSNSARILVGDPSAQYRA
jgi:hypothetical protein